MNIVKIALLASVYSLPSFAKNLNCSDVKIYEDQVKGIACAKQYSELINNKVRRSVHVKQDGKMVTINNCACSCLYRNGVIGIGNDKGDPTESLLCDSWRNFQNIIATLQSNTGDEKKFNQDELKNLLMFTDGHFATKAILKGKKNLGQ